MIFKVKPKKNVYNFRFKRSASLELSELGASVSTKDLSKYDKDLPSETPTSSDKDSDFDPKSQDYNTSVLKELPRVCDRFGVSDRVGAAIATATLIDHGIVTPKKKEIITR